MEAWSPPDQGMHQREYSESELEDQFSNMDESVEERSPPRNPFIDLESVRVAHDHLLARSRKGDERGAFASIGASGKIWAIVTCG